MKILAPAKINLSLDVLGEREDGYHLLRMIMQTVSLYDEIELNKLNTSTVPTVHCTVPIVQPAIHIPTDDSNLAVRAAKLLMDEFDIREPLEICLTKRIPDAAGLAGGSADAAAVLRGVNKLFGLGLSQKELMTRAVRLGADVPFCVLGGTALAAGIGEELTELPTMPPCHILIAKPGIEVSTQFVYTNYRDERVKQRPETEDLIRNLSAGDLDGLAGGLCNVLESVTIPAHPVIREIKEKMRSLGAKGALMSGSGPTVFGIFEDGARAADARMSLEESGLSAVTFLVTPCGNEEIA